MGNEIKTGAMSNGNFVVTYQQNGNGGCIPVIDGTPHPELMFGYVSEQDKQAGLKLLEDALRATNGNIPKAMSYMYNAVQTAANDIKADAAIDVDGTEVIISYVSREAYIGTSLVAKLDDITCELPDEAVKALLVDRVRLYLEEQAREQEQEMNEDEDDDEVLYGIEFVL